MRASQSNRGAIIKSHLCAESNRTHAAIASRLCSAALINFRADTAKRREKFGF
jgi:hypothetical protein